MKFCAEFDADSKTVIVFLLALIVFDLFSFEGSKMHFTGEANVYIAIYILIMSIITLLGDFDAINTSNQRIICSYIFQPSWFILYFIFSVNSIIFYEIFYNDVTASCDITYLFTNPDEICTACVKLNSKHILLMRIF